LVFAPRGKPRGREQGVRSELAILKNNKKGWKRRKPFKKAGDQGIAVKDDGGKKKSSNPDFSKKGVRVAVFGRKLSGCVWGFYAKKKEMGS